MNNNDQYKQFFNDDGIDQDKLIPVIPSEQKPLDYERVPDGYDPMQAIHQRGRAARGFASGVIPWWVIISGWIMLGGFSFLMIGVAISLGFLGFLAILPFVLIYYLILRRGTFAKFSATKSRTR